MLKYTRIFRLMKGAFIFMSKYYDLLKSYCDKLIEYQVKEISAPALYGGVLCPACSMIHGRISDAVYPLSAMFDITKNEKYIEAAKGIVEWSENNVLRKNGAYYNDKPSAWNRTTTFAQIAFGEALIYHGKCLDKNTYEKWFSIFKRQTDFIYNELLVDKINSNINYYITAAACMAVAYYIIGDEKYKKRAYEIMDYSVNFFSEDGLLFGECKPFAIDYESPRGCRGVDIGYNAEETLPSMVLFAYYLKDEKYYELAKKYFKTHIEFMIPDGGWDNSWGCRADKWTYWGSRTSDGCQAALSILAKDDPIFAEAAERNFDMLAYCSKEGLLYGGYMYIECGEDACTHHSFCHAKALAGMIDHAFEHKISVKLPRDDAYGLKYFPSVHINLAAVGDFRATVSDNDVIRQSGMGRSGGALNLLWHKDIGPIFAAAMPIYTMFEARNMQLSNNFDNINNITLRIEKDCFSNVNERNASITSSAEKDVIISASGQLCNIDYEANGNYEIVYTFSEKSVKIKAASSIGGVLKLPVICSLTDPLKFDGNNAVISRKGSIITLKSDDAVIFDKGGDERGFNLVGGFSVANLAIELYPNKASEVEITVKKL